MPPLSDPTTWQTKAHQTRGYLYIDKPTVVFSGQVNQASAVYPIAQVTIDNTSGSPSNAKIDHLVVFGTAPGLNDLGNTRIRKASSTTVLFIGESSQGRGWGEVDIQDNAFFTVYDTYPVMSIPPHFDTSNGTLYKDFDRLSSEGNQTEPVANAGVHMIGFVDGGTSKLTVDFDGSGSYVTEEGATISSHNWTFNTGSTPSSASTATVNDVTFDPGRRWIDLTVIDSNLSLSIARRLVVALEKTGANAPIYNFEVRNRSLTQTQHTISFDVYEDIPLDEYPDNTLVIYFEREWYDGVEGSLAGPADRQHVKFVGYMTDLETRIEATENGVRQVVTVNATDFMGMLQQTRGFSQELTSVTGTPTSWFEQQDATIDRMAHYILKWHSTVLTVTDFYWSTTTTRYPFVRLGADAGNIFAQIEFLADAIAHKFTTDQRGRLYMKPDPMLLDVSGGATLTRTSTVIVHLAEEWVNASYREPYPPLGLLDGEAIQASATEIAPLFCKAPNFVPSQGGDSKTWTSRLVTGQAELNAQTGHAYARANADTGLWDIQVPQGGDAGIEPGLMEWLTMDVSASVAAQRGYTFTLARFLPLEVTWRYNHETGGVEQRIRAEKETVGQPAATFVPPQDNTIYNVDAPGADFDYQPATGITPLAPGTGTVAAFLENGIAITNDWTTPSASGGPTWSFISLASLKAAGLSSSVTAIYGATVDAYSSRYINGSGGVDAWFVSDQGVHKITNIFGSYAVTNVHTWANPQAADAHLNYCIHSERGQQNLVAALQHRGAGKTNPGTYVAVSSNGTSFTENQLTAHTQSSNAARPGVFVSGKLANTVYAMPLSASGTTTAASQLWKTTDAGVNWAQTTSPVNPAGLGGRGPIHIPFDGHTDDSILYWGVMLYTAVTSMGRAVGATNSTINPASNGPRFQHGIASDSDNRQLMAVATLNNTGLYVSSDAGDTWTAKFTGAPETRWCHVVQGTVYYGGVTGRLGYLDSFAGTPDSKVGNLASLSTADIWQLVGG